MTLIGQIERIQSKIPGAGGWQTGADVADDGTLIARNDTHNAHVLAAGGSTWQMQLVPGTSCNASDLDVYYEQVDPWGWVGSYDVAIAATNSERRAIVCMGYVWTKESSAFTYRRQNLAQADDCFPNQPARMSGKPLAFDPANPNVLVFGTPLGGVKYCLDITAATPTWVSIATGTIPLPTAGARYSIAFDRSSAVTSGRTQTVYIHVPGSGVYRSTTGINGTFTLMTAPTSGWAACHMRCSPTGILFLTGAGVDNPGQLRRWASGAWTEPTGCTATKDICFSSQNAGHYYFCGPGSGLNVSTNSGVSWQLDNGLNVAANARSGGDIPWHVATNENYMSNGCILFSPIANRIHCFEGLGHFETDNPPTTMTYTPATTITWRPKSNGLENMVTTLLCFNEYGDLGYACHDRAMFVIPRADLGKRFPTAHGPNYINQLNHGGDIDFVPGQRGKWYSGAFNYPAQDLGWTADSGASWNYNGALTTASGGAGGGNIAVLSATNMLRVQTNQIYPPTGQAAKNGLYWTNDAGATYALLTIGDNQALFNHANYALFRRTLEKDRFTPGRAYFYNIGDQSGSASDLACRGIWRIDDPLTGAAPTITRVKSTAIISFEADKYNGKFVQGTDAAEWYWFGGDNAVGLRRSRDGMATWTTITGTDNINGASGFGDVYGLGLSVVHPDTGKASILVAGHRMVTPTTGSSISTFGYWLCIDGEGTSWTRYAQTIDGFDHVTDMAGSPTDLLFVVGFNGTGASLIRYRDQRAQN